MVRLHDFASWHDPLLIRMYFMRAQRDEQVQVLFHINGCPRACLILMSMAECRSRRNTAPHTERCPSARLVSSQPTSIHLLCFSSSITGDPSSDIMRVSVLPVLAAFFFGVVSAADNRSERGIEHDDPVGAFHGKSVRRASGDRDQKANKAIV